MAQGAGGPIYLGWSWQVSDKVTVERDMIEVRKGAIWKYETLLCVY